ncbi:hypothetical protein CLU79DRAFT_742677 [Phycomyces nitens]|nr:hypothetical protein CLU79DRAFT_742677 [Phycomyces nitens]
MPKMPKVPKMRTLKDIVVSLYRSSARVFGLHRRSAGRNREPSVKTESSILSSDSVPVDTRAVCGCGKLLSPGWECAECRPSCPTCHRALEDANALCGRCARSNPII